MSDRFDLAHGPLLRRSRACRRAAGPVLVEGPGVLSLSKDLTQAARRTKHEIQNGLRSTRPTFRSDSRNHAHLHARHLSFTLAP